MQEHIVGLDLGTSASAFIGFKLNSDDEGKDTKIEINDHCVYVYKEPVHKSSGIWESKKTARRKYRQARRQRDRRVDRLQALANLNKKYLKDDVSSNIIYNKDEIELIKKYQSLALRALAAQRPIGLDQLSKVFLHLSKSRGYSSGFRPLSEKKKKN